MSAARLLIGLTLLWFLGLLGFTQVYLQPLGAAPPLDARVSGYDLATVQTYLDALTPKAVAMLQWLRRLDTVFPPLLMASFLCLTPRAFWPAALIYCGTDLAENAAIAKLIVSGADAASVAWASRLTEVKWAMVLLCLSGVVIRQAGARRSAGRP